MNIRYRVTLLADEMVRLTAHESDLRRDDSASARRDGAQAVAGEDVVHPEGRRGIRRPHGGRARALRRARRRAHSPVVCFDETPRQLIGEERVPVRAEPGKTRSLRLRVRAQRHRERLHVCRRQSAVAARQGDRPEDVPSTSPSACATSSTCTIQTCHRADCDASGSRAGLPRVVEEIRTAETGTVPESSPGPSHVALAGTPDTLDRAH